jgi:hypothetical protein
MGSGAATVISRAAILPSSASYMFAETHGNLAVTINELRQDSLLLIARGSGAFMPTPVENPYAALLAQAVAPSGLTYASVPPAVMTLSPR